MKIDRRTKSNFTTVIPVFYGAGSRFHPDVCTSTCPSKETVRSGRSLGPRTFTDLSLIRQEYSFRRERAAGIPVERRLADSRAETKSIASAVRNNVDPLGRCHATRIMSAMLLSTHLVNSILSSAWSPCRIRSEAGDASSSATVSSALVWRSSSCL